MRIAIIVVGLALGVIVLGIAFWAMQCPCGRIPGTWLQGEEDTRAVPNWGFANAEPICYIEVQGAPAHSVTLNCMADAEGSLYLSCSRCEGKRWSTIAVNTGMARIRIGDTVYPVSIERVLEPGELDRAWAARASKLAQLRGRTGEPRPRPDHWWSFRLESRG